jgi:ribonuclease R/exosome complex exonuclease DIS3/RRP44
MAKSKKQPKRYLFEEVLTFLKHNSEKSFNYKQLGAAMEIDNESDRFTLLETLEELKHQGFVIEREIGKYQAKETKTYETGTIDFTTSGAAYVIISADSPDVYIPFRRSKDSLHGDLVKISLTSKNRSKPEGEVVEVIKRKKTKFVGTIQINQKFKV